MEFKIIEAPIRFHLYGLSSTVQNNNFGEAGMKLMNEMWKIVKESQTRTTGVNHWVYLPDNRMLVGVELLPNSGVPELLEPMAFELHRYLKHVHIGPYQALPSKWASLKCKLDSLGETISLPSLEVYGHHCDEQSEPETTILIGLHQK